MSRDDRLSSDFEQQQTYLTRPRCIIAATVSGSEPRAMQESILRWAWAATQRQLGGFVLGGVGLGLTAAVLSAFVTLPPNPTLVDRLIYGLVPLVGGVVLTVGLGWLWNLSRAPI